MRFRVVAVLFCALAFSVANAQKKPLNNFKGYKKLPGDSYLKYLEKGKGTAVADTGGALFIKVFFLAESDTAFIDLNKETETPSYPMRFDQYVYAGDFLFIMGQLHVGDSVKFYMSLDSLHKYFPDEFVFAEPHNSMKYIGMAVKVDSLYTREKVKHVQAEAAAQREAEYRQILTDDSLQLRVYLVENEFPLKPDQDSIWYRTVVAGEADTVRVGDEISVRYKATYPDGTVVDEQTFTYVVGEGTYIDGWNIAIARMHLGEKAICIMPSNMAYDDGHTWIFEIKLLDIEHQ